MKLYEYLASIENVLDLQHDLLTYLVYTYPSFFTNIEMLLSKFYIVANSLISTLVQTCYTLISVKYLNNAIFNIGIKFILLIALLVFVRGGIPRYRFDFLTKIG